MTSDLASEVIQGRNSKNVIFFIMKLVIEAIEAIEAMEVFEAVEAMEAVEVMEAI